MEECEVGSDGSEGEKPPAIDGGQGAMTSFGCCCGCDAKEDVGAGRGDNGSQERSERCLVMNRTIGEVRKSSSVHCSQRSRSVVSCGVSRWRGFGVVIVFGLEVERW